MIVTVGRNGDGDASSNLGRGCVAYHNHNSIISMTTVIHANTKHNRWTPFSRYETFINFWLRFFDTRRETQFLSLSYYTMLTTPKRSAHLEVQSQFLNLMIGSQLSASMAENSQLSVYMIHSQLPIDSFSKSSNSLHHRLRAWRHSHSSLISYLGFIMTIVIIISFAHERKTVPNICVPELRAE